MEWPFNLHCVLPQLFKTQVRNPGSSKDFAMFPYMQQRPQMIDAEVERSKVWTWVAVLKDQACAESDKPAVVKSMAKLWDTADDLVFFTIFLIYYYKYSSFI